MRTRAERRHNTRKVHKRKERLLNYIHKNMREFDIRKRKLKVKTGTLCSCFLCCNPRRRGEITLQEKRAEVNEEEQVNE